MLGGRAVRAAVCVLVMSATPVVAAPVDAVSHRNRVLAGTSELMSVVTRELHNTRSIFAGRDFALDDVRLEPKTSLLSMPVSEPATMLLFGASLLGIARRARRS